MWFVALLAFVVLAVVASVCVLSDMRAKEKEREEVIAKIHEIQDKIDNMPEAVLKALKDIKE